jgi:hypothetical protein
MPWHVHEPILHIVLPPPHATHAAPPVPHWEMDCEPCWTHVVPLQQPLGHEVASHTHMPVAALHSWPDAHVAHIPPPMPHAVLDCEPGATHVPPGVQQPLGHELAVHTQWPVLVSQDWPDAQAEHKVPPAPHDAFDSLDRGSHMAPEVQQPAHAEPPQVHIPPEQLPPAAHGAHMAPPLPHEELDCAENGSHWPLALQQPEGHVEGSHGGAVSATASPGASLPCATSAVASLPSAPEGASIPELLLPEDEPDPSSPPSPVGAGL